MPVDVPKDETYGTEEKLCFYVAPPDPPTNVGVASSKETSQLVTWSAANDNGAPVTSYNVEMKNEPDGEWTFVGNVNATEYEVHGLLPFNGYSYRVYANNDYGQGKASEKSVPVVTLSGGKSLVLRPHRRILLQSLRKNKWSAQPVLRA